MLTFLPTGNCAETKSSPMKLTTREFFFQLNPCSRSPYVLSSLTSDKSMSLSLMNTLALPQCTYCRYSMFNSFQSTVVLGFGFFPDCYMFWNGNPFSKRGEVWLLLVTPPLLGSDFAGGHSHTLAHFCLSFNSLLQLNFL
jgi:hypothetical protein